MLIGISGHVLELAQMGPEKRAVSEDRRRAAFEKGFRRTFIATFGMGYKAFSCQDLTDWLGNIDSLDGVVRIV